MQDYLIANSAVINGRRYLVKQSSGYCNGIRVSL